MSIDVNEFFTSWNDIATAKPKHNPVWNNKLKLEKGNEYLVRFVPYLKEGKEGYHKSTFRFWTYAWQSVIDGKWIYVLSPRTWGERCPISEFYFKTKSTNNEALQNKLKKLSYKEGCYYNVYVVSDPSEPENEGKVKVLQASKQLNSVIEAAISDDPKVVENNREELEVDNLRTAMFDLTSQGVNLCIDVQDQGGFPNYKSSKFVRRKKNLGLSEDEINTIYESAFDLTKIDQKRTVEEIEELFRTTFLGQKATTHTTTRPAPVVVSESEDKDPIVEAQDEPTSEISDLDELDNYLNNESNF